MQSFVFFLYIVSPCVWLCVAFVYVSLRLSFSWSLAPICISFSLLYPFPLASFLFHPSPCADGRDKSLDAAELNLLDTSHRNSRLPRPYRPRLGHVGQCVRWCGVTGCSWCAQCRAARLRRARWLAAGPRPGTAEAVLRGCEVVVVVVVVVVTAAGGESKDGLQLLRPKSDLPLPTRSPRTDSFAAADRVVLRCGRGTKQWKGRYVGK